MIPEEYKDRIVQDGLIFISTISAAYGAEEGIKLWEAISEAIDPDIKGEIFMAMLTGVLPGRVIIKGLPATASYSSVDRISFIRTIREHTGLGLRESKEAMEKVWNGGEVTLMLSADTTKGAAVRALRSIGVDWI